MVWGCISSKGMGDLAFIETTMNAQKYHNILKSHLPSIARKLEFYPQFYQDNDPKHKVQMIRMWLLYNCGTVIDTTPLSPDMNPIKNIWAYIKKVAKQSSNKAVWLPSVVTQNIDFFLLFTIVK